MNYIKKQAFQVLALWVIVMTQSAFAASDQGNEGNNAASAPDARAQAQPFTRRMVEEFANAVAPTVHNMLSVEQSVLQNFAQAVNQDFVFSRELQQNPSDSIAAHLARSLASEAPEYRVSNQDQMRSQFPDFARDRLRLAVQQRSLHDIGVALGRGDVASATSMIQAQRQQRLQVGAGQRQENVEERQALQPLLRAHNAEVQAVLDRDRLAGQHRNDIARALIERRSALAQSDDGQGARREQQEPRQSGILQFLLGRNAAADMPSIFSNMARAAERASEFVVANVDAIGQAARAQDSDNSDNEEDDDVLANSFVFSPREATGYALVMNTSDDEGKETKEREEKESQERLELDAKRVAHLALETELIEHLKHNGDMELLESEMSLWRKKCRLSSAESRHSIESAWLKRLKEASLEAAETGDAVATCRWLKEVSFCGGFEGHVLVEAAVKAVSHGHIGVVDAILTANADIVGELLAEVVHGVLESNEIENMESPEIEHDKFHALKALLSDPRIKKHALTCEANGRSFWNHYIAEHDMPRVVVEELLRSGVFVDTMDQKSGKTALHTFTSFRMPDLAATLLENRANPDLQDLEGATPLIIAAKNGYETLARMLIFSGSDEFLTTYERPGGDYVVEKPFDRFYRGKNALQSTVSVQERQALNDEDEMHRALEWDDARYRALCKRVKSPEVQDRIARANKKRQVFEQAIQERDEAMVVMRDIEENIDLSPNEQQEKFRELIASIETKPGIEYRFLARTLQDEFYKPHSGYDVSNFRRMKRIALPEVIEDLPAMIVCALRDNEELLVRWLLSKNPADSKWCACLLCGESMVTAIKKSPVKKEKGVECYYSASTVCTHHFLCYPCKRILDDEDKNKNKAFAECSVCAVLASPNPCELSEKESAHLRYLSHADQYKKQFNNFLKCKKKFDDAHEPQYRKLKEQFYAVMRADALQQLRNEMVEQAATQAHHAAAFGTEKKDQE